MCANLQLRWDLKQNYNACRELSNGMWHATCTQGGQGSSWLLMVRSQIGNLTFGLSFGHNLCFNYPNGSCKPTLDIYVLKYFQWYKLFNPLGFDPCDRSLKIREPIRIPIPKLRAHLRVWRFIPSHFSTLSHSQEHEMWLSGFTLGSHLCKPLPWSRAQG